MTELTSKDELRKYLRNQRHEFVSALPLFAVERSFSAIPSVIDPLLKDIKCVGLYAPQGDEAPALRYATALVSRGIDLALPAIERGQMVFRAWAPQDSLINGYRNIGEPSPDNHIAEPDLVFAPLVGFDLSGNRLGQGGGFYDRYLSDHENCRSIGLAWSVQHVENLPIEPYDRTLDAIITEQSVRIFD